MMTRHPWLALVAGGLAPMAVAIGGSLGACSTGRVASGALAGDQVATADAGDAGEVSEADGDLLPPETGLPSDADLDAADSALPLGDSAYPPLALSDIGAPVPVSEQFLFTEGPIWDPAKEVLYFTDINASTIYLLTPPNTIAPLLDPSQNANGLALDPQGNLLVAGFVSRAVERVEGATLDPIATSYQSMKLNSPDDIIARSDGVIYFTDPTFGINGSQGFKAQTQELGFEGVYRLTTDGILHLEDQSMATPNGIELSPDEGTLYVSFTTPGAIQKYSVAADGTLGTPTSFATGVTLADSMCVDAAGDVYVASYGGIAVFEPSGTFLGTIATTQIPTNCAFGGPDQRTLFITARTALTGTPKAGNASLLRIDGMPIPGLPGRP